jgi:hypothetical protein
LRLTSPLGHDGSSKLHSIAIKEEVMIEYVKDLETLVSDLERGAKPDEAQVGMLHLLIDALRAPKIWLLTIVMVDDDADTIKTCIPCATRERAVERLKEWVRVENDSVGVEEGHEDNVEEYFANCDDTYSIEEVEVLQ